MRRLPLLIALLAMAAAACTSAGGGSSPPSSGTASGAPSASPSTGAVGTYSVLPTLISSEQVVGSSRFLFSFVDTKTNEPAGAPDRTASVTAYPSAAGPSSAITGQGRFVWSIPDVVGYYVTTLAFDQPGEWIATFTTEAPGKPTESIGPFTFDVKADGAVVQVGEAAPAVKTPTLADVGGDVSKISSDKSPDPDLYRVSVDEALAAGKPFVVVFATPAFCTSAACGPLLDTVKSVVTEFPDLTVINVEPYQLVYQDGKLQPVRDANGQFQPVVAADAFGILSEPWLFVVDGAGKVSASIEGVTDASELRAVFEAVGGS